MDSNLADPNLAAPVSIGSGSRTRCTMPTTSHHCSTRGAHGSATGIAVWNQLLLLVLVMWGASCGSSPPEVLRHEGEDEEIQPPVEGFAREATWVQTLGPGDVLRVNVFDHPQLSSMLLRDGLSGSPIQGDGSIQLPLIGDLEVMGLTPTEVSRLVEQRLLPYIKAPRVDVAVIENGSKRIFVFGAVKKPGSFPLRRPTNILEAIGIGGGFNSFANREDVAWLRVGREDEPLILINADELDMLLAMPVEAGDLIFVGRRDWANVSEAVRDILPLIQGISSTLGLGLQAATLERL
jgi:polysaccharide export outer membrane protein